MKSLPWFKFAPQAWRGDQSLRAVSIAARGLWIECLCIMHEAKPYGHLVLNGASVKDDVLARMAGVSVDEVSDLMAELRQAGVYSMTGKGVIFSRRMARDFSKAQKGKKSANKRWSQVAENKQENIRPNGSPSRHPNAKSIEVRDKNKDAYQHPIDAGGSVDLNILENELRKAANLERSPSPKLFVLAPILGLIKSGHDLELDILPTLRSVAAKSKRAISTWDYFTEAIRETNAKRRGAESKGLAPSIAPEKSKANIFEQLKGSQDEQSRTSRNSGATIDALYLPNSSGQGQSDNSGSILDCDRWVHDGRFASGGS